MVWGIICTLGSNWIASNVTKPESSDTSFRHSLFANVSICMHACMQSGVYLADAANVTRLSEYTSLIKSL